MAVMDRSMEGKRQYTTGISKGVFFGEDGKAFPWNGLISVTEKPQANAPTPVYNSLGEKYDQFGNIAEKKHSLTCYTYPEEMDEFLGIEYLEEMGYSVDERPPKKFSMAYRTELGDGLYEIHVLLNQIATFADTAKNTITNNITPTVVTMNLEGVPDPRIKTSHIILDSRLPLTESAERLLFGNNMVDGNINEFLDAEPTWVTVATNYAPIIEPDYDNMVWLGGENLVTNVVTSTPDSYLVYSFKTSNNPSTNDVLTFSLDATYPPDRAGIYLWYNDGTSNKLITRIHALPGSSRHSVTFEYPEGPVVQFRVYAGSSNANFVATPGDTVLDKVKMEAGSVATPWTPAPSDNYVPPADQPRPANYVPKPKSAIFWDGTGSYPNRNSIAYYDEQTRSLGLYSTKLSGDQYSYLAISLSDNTGSHKDLERRFYVETNVIDPSKLGADRMTVRVEYPVAAQLIPNSVGTYVTDLKHVSQGDSVNMRLYHPGYMGDGYITFNKLMYVDSSYTGPFFNVFTKPKTKGDRYVRVSRNSGDYTEHQQLILQSKSRVILSDITPNQYTLEASDSQLRVDGQTFTFKGPQATPVGDDQFTINDEIYGEE